MRAALSRLAVERPRTLDEALRRLADRAGPRPIPLAGGTDLFVYLNAGTALGNRYLDLWGLRELRGIEIGRRSIRLGALATFSQIRAHPVLRRRMPALVAAAAEVGARQIQNRATVAGNIANASPAADSLPPLMALGAVIHVRSVQGSRSIPLDEMFLGYRKLALRPDELIVGVELPMPATGSIQFFRKVGTRRAQSIAKVVMGGSLTLARRSIVEGVRLSFGSMAPIPIRARRAEAALEGAALSRESRDAAIAELSSDLSPIDDIRSDRDYRLRVAGALLAQFVRTAAATRGRSPSLDLL